MKERRVYIRALSLCFRVKPFIYFTKRGGSKFWGRTLLYLEGTPSRAWNLGESGKPSRYESPIGRSRSRATNDSGLWFDGQNMIAPRLRVKISEPRFAHLCRNTFLARPVLQRRGPDFTPPLKLKEPRSDARSAALMLAIPYGRRRPTAPWRKLSAGQGPFLGARRRRRGRATDLARRPVPSSDRPGKLTGYAGGLEKKIWLRQHEGVALDQLSR